VVKKDVAREQKSVKFQKTKDRPQGFPEKKWRPPKKVV
jgi:hypothetical protein